jgi:hypothetical protein
VIEQDRPIVEAVNELGIGSPEALRCRVQLGKD